MELSSLLLEKICECEGIKKDQLVLHSDNGGAMKGATMFATLQKLGIIPSFSRPRVSDDNPYSESLFKTLKYCPEKQVNSNGTPVSRIRSHLLFDGFNSRHSFQEQ